MNLLEKSEHERREPRGSAAPVRGPARARADRLLSPFPAGYRASGVLMHVTSLPSRYGVGDVGPSAFAWIDRLHDAGQTFWQALPLGPTGYDNSPYQPLSSMARNEILISPELLIDEGLLRADECAWVEPHSKAVDYASVIPFKHRLLDRIWTHYNDGTFRELRHAFDGFREREGGWLEDYTLFRALKERHNGARYLDWPDELVRRDPAALARARGELATRVDQLAFAQFTLFRQWNQLRRYAEARGVHLVGDLPFFVSAESSDVWAHPELFLLDAQRRPRFVAGVPPDAFSERGQLWGNPVYDWDAHRRTGYRWFIDRLRAILVQVDVVRLDHFLAFSAGWHVPATATDARTGKWQPGPGGDLFDSVEEALGGLPFIAEDLGIITLAVRNLRDVFRIPGTKVLQLAFDGNPNNPFLPHRYVHNCVAYTGTHDNTTTRAWYEQLTDWQRAQLWRYVKRSPGDGSEAAAALLQLAWSSPAAVAIAPMQDVLNLGQEARMNVPGRAGGNWRWRCTEDMLSPLAFERLRSLTTSAARVVAG